ncbi:MAG TPA: hypothetical protein VMT72_16635 [Pseudolabrys sp.]|nr:hypothetical protein [Pseudolabrys sp.]
MSTVEPREQVQDRALEITINLALGRQQDILGTKRSLNMGWLTSALPQHELSRALELVGPTSADYLEARQPSAKSGPALPLGPR